MPNSEAILQANEKLRSEIAGFQKSLRTVEAKEHRTRNLAYILSVIVALLIVWGLYAKVQDANDKADRNTEYLTVACAAQNDFRSVELNFFTGLLQDSAREPKNKSPQKQAQIQALQQRINKVYAARDCSKVKDGQVAPATAAPSAKP